MYIRLTQTPVSVRFSLVKSYRGGHKTPRQRHLAYLGSIKHANLADSAKVEDFLSLLVQSLYSASLTTDGIRHHLEKLAGRIPAFNSFFLNFK